MSEPSDMTVIGVSLMIWALGVITVTAMERVAVVLAEPPATIGLRSADGWRNRPREAGRR